MLLSYVRLLYMLLRCLRLLNMLLSCLRLLYMSLPYLRLLYTLFSYLRLLYKLLSYLRLLYTLFSYLRPLYMLFSYLRLWYRLLSYFRLLYILLSYLRLWYMLLSYLRLLGVRMAHLVQHWTRDRKVTGSTPSRSGGRIFSSRVNFLCWLSIGVRSTPVLPQWYLYDPGHSANSAGGWLHLNTLTPSTQRSRSGLTMPLLRHSVGTVRNRNHMRLVREHSATVIWARWATVDWSWPKEWN